MRKITEYGDYILGKKFTDYNSKPYRMTNEDIKELKRLLIVHPTAMQNLAAINSPKLFYSKEPDMKNDIPVAKRDEYFYVAKIGKTSLEVPAKVVFFIEMAIKEYGSPNYFLYLMQERDLEETFSQGYLANGMTVKDIVANITGFLEYMPLSEGRLKSQVSDKQFDIFIEEENAIAMLPKDLSDNFAFADIQKIKLEGKKLQLNGRPIAQLGHYIGVVNSIYDFRDII